MVESAYSLGETRGFLPVRAGISPSAPQGTPEEEECLAHQSTDLHTFFLMQHKVEALLRRFMMFSRPNTSFPCKFLWHAIPGFPLQGLAWPFVSKRWQQHLPTVVLFPVCDGFGKRLSVALGDPFIPCTELIWGQWANAIPSCCHCASGTGCQCGASHRGGRGQWLPLGSSQGPCSVRGSAHAGGGSLAASEKQPVHGQLLQTPHAGLWIGMVSLQQPCPRSASRLGQSSPAPARAAAALATPWEGSCLLLTKWAHLLSAAHGP